MISKPEIPDKVFFRIGEVSRLTGVKPYILRYWETEFPTLKPQKTKSGQRMYRRKDVETVLLIKDYLYGQRFTIEGARKMLAKGKEKTDEAGEQLEFDFSRGQIEDVLKKIKRDLKSLQRILKS